jgi:tryptophan 2,3-dioxygenase
MSLTYSSYLKLDELLSLQEPLSEGPAHDEMLFIVIHQTYELWFKEVLHEVDHLNDLLRENDSTRVLHTLKRVLSIFRILLTQLETLETMTPVGFLTFRKNLGTASGFQSFQFRELEFVLGHKQEAPLSRFPQESKAGQKLQRRYEQPTLWDAFLVYLKQNGHSVPEDLLNRDIRQPVQPSREMQRTLLSIYHNDPAAAFLCELLVDLDEALQEWRYRHVKMVERMIGTKYGTGGSSGVEYLKKTLFTPSFPDLWAIRTEIEVHDQ